MSETTMPAAEAAVADASEMEQQSYEFAFHVLPTVAEGEVAGVFEALKGIITKEGGEIFDEEAPERFDLAYEIVQHIEGKNRKFGSAYFGWVRFRVTSDAIESITAEMDGNKNILRYLVLRLTKVEEQNPFRFHEALVEQKMVTTVEESKVVPDFTTVTDESDTPDTDEEEAGEVDETELDAALKKEVE